MYTRYRQEKADRASATLEAIRDQLYGASLSDIHHKLSLFRVECNAKTPDQKKVRPFTKQELGLKLDVRALVAAENAADSEGLKEGVAMVAKQLDDTLAKYAVHQIPAEGEAFDPNVHEAISQMPSDLPAGMVAHVAQTGFQMHDRVVRPSQVVVSTGPAAE